jgi:hypothetical protein
LIPLFNWEPDRHRTHEQAQAHQARWPEGNQVQGTLILLLCRLTEPPADKQDTGQSRDNPTGNYYRAEVVQSGDVATASLWKGASTDSNSSAWFQLHHFDLQWRHSFRGRGIRFGQGRRRPAVSDHCNGQQFCCNEHGHGHLIANPLTGCTRDWSCCRRRRASRRWSCRW